MSQVTTVLRRDKHDGYIYHLGYYTASSAYSHVCSFHHDNLWDLFGREWAERLEASLGLDEEMAVEFTLKEKEQ